MPSVKANKLLPALFLMPGYSPLNFFLEVMGCAWMFSAANVKFSLSILILSMAKRGAEQCWHLSVYMRSKMLVSSSHSEFLS